MSEQESLDAGDASSDALRREIGLWGAVLMGLGSILGTGVFVSIGIGAGVAGPAVLVAIAMAAVVAMCNGLSSAQLAAAHPVSGGTYEYGYRFLTPSLGFIAGWMYLLAKSASAATAALGFAGYFLHTFGLPAGPWLVPLALSAVVLLTCIVVGGIRRSNAVNAVIVSVTLATLSFFMLAGAPSVDVDAHLTPFWPTEEEGGASVSAVLEAAALMFVAYTGYGRVATLGEEVRDPGRTIPRAVIATLSVTMVFYLGVALVALGAVGAVAYAEAATQDAAPLEIIAQTFGVPGGGWILAFGAITAMLGVLLNLILGLSRVLFAMGRRRDMPAALEAVGARTQSPTTAVVVMGAVIGALVLVGDVKTTWAFSAFTVLLYYSLTNLSALWMPDELRRYPRVISVMGLVGCLGLAFWVDPMIWWVGLGLGAVGYVLRTVSRSLQSS